MAAIRRSALATVLALLFAASALAQPKVPNERTLETLVKSSLVSFNDAVATGNYTVFHATLAKPLRDKFSPDQLKSTFKAFAEQKAEFYVVTAYKPTYDPAPAINQDGVLELKGIFPTEPSKVAFDLKFLLSDNGWRLVGINVKMLKAD
jgi:hypothetical protein